MILCTTNKEKIPTNKTVAWCFTYNQDPGVCHTHYLHALKQETALPTHSLLNLLVFLRRLLCMCISVTKHSTILVVGVFLFQFP